jgi:protein-S-isoprenylcysteine O-methyltransferase Ste14
VNSAAQRLLSGYYAARGWILAGVFAIIVWGRATHTPADRPLHGGMLGLIAIGMLLRAWAGAHIGGHSNGSKADAPVLATTGPYAFSRHPLYLSNLAIGAGLLFFANALSEKDTVAVLLFLWIHHLVLVRWEEKTVREKWPVEYDAYAAATPRWFGLKPPAGSENITDTRDWRPVCARQGRNLLYALACVLLLLAAAWMPWAK